MFYVVLSMVVSSSVFGFGEVIFGIPVGTVSIALVAFGFLLSDQITRVFPIDWAMDFNAAAFRPVYFSISSIGFR